MNDMKPGFKTSELWVTLLTVVGTLLLGYVSVEQAAVIAPKAEAAASWLALAGMLAGPAAAIAAGLYAKGRTELKKSE